MRDFGFKRNEIGEMAMLGRPVHVDVFLVDFPKRYQVAEVKALRTHEILPELQTWAQIETREVPLT